MPGHHEPTSAPCSWLLNLNVNGGASTVGPAGLHAAGSAASDAGQVSSASWCRGRWHARSLGSRSRQINRQEWNRRRQVVEQQAASFAVRGGCHPRDLPPQRHQFVLERCWQLRPNTSALDGRTAPGASLPTQLCNKLCPDARHTVGKLAEGADAGALCAPLAALCFRLQPPTLLGNNASVPQVSRPTLAARVCLFRWRVTDHKV